jgi:glyoxylase-like metal-dependent hydrolase (beta-lactamase superfamily II)/8-oxo-dGTP pyrophosphatase MutT (NUDIX family)
MMEPLESLPPEPVEPRPAATLVLMRDSATGPQVLLTTRPRSMRFMGGATVFPGGAVAPPDRDPAWEELSILGRHEAGEKLGLEDDVALGAFVCALRETFEEVGLLLSSGQLRPGARASAADAQGFLDACLDSAVQLRTDLLVPAGSWVTPLGAPVRFDARFFVTEAPEGWEPSPDPREVEDAFWMMPSQALVGMSSGKLLMAPPTIEMLQLLDGYDSVEAALGSVGAVGLTGAGSVISTRVSPMVHLVLAPNPGLMTGPGTNTYIVGPGPSAIIDPAVDDEEYIEAILDAASDPEVILVTHRHPDHVGGIAELVRRTGLPVRAFGDDRAGDCDVVRIPDGEVITVGGLSLRAMHAPGHASDHLVFYVPTTASLFAGDNVLGEGTAVIAPPDGDMRDYMETLEKLQGLYIDRIFPGHFRPLDGGNQVIQHYIEHRLQREQAILAAVRAGATTDEEIVEQVYTDTPPALHPIARYSVLAHLEMLAEQGLVRVQDDRWTTGSSQ